MCKKTKKKKRGNLSWTLLQNSACHLFKKKKKKKKKKKQTNKIKKTKHVTLFKIYIHASFSFSFFIVSLWGNVPWDFWNDFTPSLSLFHNCHSWNLLSSLGIIFLQKVQLNYYFFKWMCKLLLWVFFGTLDKEVIYPFNFLFYFYFLCISLSFNYICTKASHVGCVCLGFLYIWILKIKKSIFIYLDNFLKIIKISKKLIFNFFVKIEKSSFWKKINF